ncbi:MAG: heme exporter protein CcmD [Burkholderiales bacterium]|jgi:heme exporter protein D
MHWSSVGEFLAMGGYGLYVWGAYAVTALIIVAETIALIRRARTLRAETSRSAHAAAD